ncbi:MAG TPA: hypothetical protein VI363_10810, partial [Burkholderiales bacterium]
MTRTSQRYSGAAVGEAARPVAMAAGVVCDAGMQASLYLFYLSFVDPLSGQETCPPYPKG